MVETDVLVVGGGLGESTAAAQFAERGRRVLPLDEDRHPPFHIGESLLPRNLPLFDRVLLDYVRARGVDVRAKYRGDRTVSAE